LFLAGHRKTLQNKPLLSVIGTRNPSKSAYKKTSMYLHPLLQNEWTIVSGLARGIDSFAHQITLDANGTKIAVIDSGSHQMYPKEHTVLFEQIAKTALIISEYPPHVHARKYDFPERNRIISGLSYGTLVIEAMERSGTLITVDQA